MKDGCGYDSCPCVGVNFISRYRHETDYCIDGRRVHVRANSPVVANATPRDVERLATYFLERYVNYIHWHLEQKRKGFKVKLQPFDHPWPLSAPANYRS